MEGDDIMQTLRVETVGGGWMVRGSICDNSLVFRSGADAERAASALACACARAGRPAEVTIVDWRGDPVATLEYAPASPGPGAYGAERAPRREVRLVWSVP